MDTTTYALCKKAVASAVSGVKSMSVDGQTLTINTKDSGVLKMVFPTPSDGTSVTDIDVNNKNQIVFTMSDGTEIISGVIPTVKGADGKPGKDGKAFTYDAFTEEQLEALKVKGDKGDAGKDAVSPTITENENNTDKIYKLDVTTADGTFTTPNLKGKDGSGSSTGEENVIESIKVNGVAQTVAEDKSVDITVPTVDVDKNYVDTELAKKANVSDIPSLDGYVTDEELNVKGYLTSHQDISGKVDKVKGKSLIADTEIERLKSVKNYDDTEIKTELAKKANSTDIPTKVSGLQNDSKYQTDTDVTTTLTPYATKTYVGEQISNADHLKREIVTEIPKPEAADKNTIYMLKIESVTGNDKYREYLLIDGTVQCVGDTSVDLTDYAKTTDVDKKLNNKADKTEIPTVPTNVSEFTNDAGYLTEHQDISNLVVKEEGKGLSSNDYTSEEKTKLGNIGTSQGRNLIPYPLTNRITNGITYTVQSDGSVLANGTASAENNAYYNFAYKTLKLGDTSYTLSCEVLPKSVYVYVYDETIGKAVANVSDTPVAKTFVGDSTHTYSLSINVGKGTPVSDLAIKPILEMGTIAHAYEPISESNVNLKDAIDKISTSQGRNLIHYPYYNGTSYELNGITYTVNEADGTITVNGTATKESDFRLINPYEPSGRKTLELGQTYTLSDSVNQPNGIGYQAPIYFQFVRVDTTKNDFNYGISTNYGNMTWTASDANLLQYGIRIVVRSGVTVDNVVMKPMLEVGAIAHSYEPTTESNVNLKETVKGLVTPQGKNLISYPYTSKNGTGNGITWTVNDDGTITADGTATNNAFFNLTNYIVGTWDTLHAGTYTIMDGVNLPIGGVTLQVESTTGTQYKNKTFTIEQDVVYKIFIYIPNGTVANNITFKPMLEIGSIAHNYEPTTESNVSLKKSIETKAAINDTSTTSTTETWSAKKINEKTAQNFDKRIILSVGRGTSGKYTDTANLNSADGAYLYWASTAGQEQYSVGVILYVNKGWMIIPIKETDGGTNITFSINGSILTMTKSSSNFPSAGGVIALGSSI